MPPFVEAADVDGDVEAVIGAMARARGAVPLVDEFQRALGWQRDRLEDALADAQTAGLIDS